MRALRVLLVSNALGPPTRGNGVTVRRWMAWAAEVGIEIEAVAPDAPPPAATDFDLVHGYHLVHGGVRAAELAQMLRVPLVVSLGGTDLHALDPSVGKGDWRRAGLRVVSEAALVTGALPEFGALLRARLGLDVPFVHVPRGVQRPQPRAAPRAAGPLRILLPAGIRAVKDPLLALDLAEYLRAEGLEIAFTVQGPALDEHLTAEIRRRTAQRPGFAWQQSDQPAMGAVYEAHDVVWNTSLHEGGSNAILEGLAHGLPLYVRAVTGNRELHVPRAIGRYFDPSTDSWRKEALAVHRAWAAEPPSATQARRRAALAWLAREHDPRREIEALRAAYEQAFHRSR